MTTFHIIYIARWCETRKELLESGLLTNDEWPGGKITNKKLRKCLRDYQKGIGYMGVSDTAKQTVTVRIERKRR